MEISIIVSTYNGEKYIVEQLESLKNQTMQADEVLIFDDCSTDNTIGLCEEYIKKDNLKNWHITLNGQNKGWKRNFIDGLANAKGDLIFFCDQDDIWKPEKVDEMVQIMAVRPEIDVLTTNCEAFYDDGHVVIRPEIENGEINKQPLDRRVFDTKYPGCTYCVRKDIAKKAIKYWQPDFPHDALLWRMAMFKGTLYSYNKSLIRWRRHSDSAYTRESVSSKTRETKRKWIEYGKRCILMLQDYIQEEQCTTEQKTLILDESMKWLNCRAEFYDTQSITAGLKLFKYRKYYPKIRQYFGDWYLIFVK